MNKKKIAFAFLAISALACGRTEPRRIVFYPSPTVLPTQTERVVEITSTPISTYTPIVQIVTGTPEPTRHLCVTASEAVNLRPSPSTKNYPITSLPLGARLIDFGGRDENDEGVWAFVKFGSRSGWTNISYLEVCE